MEEIKNSYNNDIQEFELMGEEYSTVVEGMKEDLQVELENLRDQFEERERKEIEKIKKNMNKINSFVNVCFLLIN